MMRVLGCLLLFGGVIVAATSSVKMPATGQTFASTLPVSVIGTIAAFAGVMLWHWSIAKERKVERHGTSLESDPFALIQAIQRPLAELNANARNISTPSMTAEVERMIKQFIIPFSLVRHKVIERFGMRTGAEVLVDFAVVERMLNRAWSAAADDYAMEAVASIDEAFTVCGELQQRVASESLDASS